MTLAAQVQQGGDPVSAAALYERAANASEASPEVLIALGNARLGAGDSQGAAKAFRKALSKRENDPQALLGLGSAELRLGQVQRAERLLAMAAPVLKDRVAYNRLGTAQVLNGQFNQALQSYELAMQKEPGNLDVRSNHALALALAGQGTKASREIASVTASPLAEPHHFKQEMLVLTLAGNDIRACQALADLDDTQRDNLLHQAQAIRAIADPAQKARAIGVLAAGN